MFLGLVFATVTTVPFTLQANHVVIPVTINGKATHALFDTGAGDAVDPALAKGLRLKLRPAGEVAGAGDATVRAWSTRVRTLQVGDITLTGERLTVLPLPPALVRGNDMRVDAIVGREVLRRYVTRIDYEAKTLTFTPANEFSPAAGDVAIPLELSHEDMAVVRASIDGLEGSFQIDTGSSASLILTTPFVDAHQLRTLLHPAGNMVVGRGVGGYTRADIALGKHFVIGPIALDDVVLDLSTDKSGAFGSRWIDGNIGNDVLERLTLTLDEPHHVVYLQRNAHTSTPVVQNRAGLYAQNDDRSAFDVVGVLPTGPAYEAGLRVGDRIVAIDGKPARDVTANAFWNLLRGAPGDVLAFTIERDGSTSTVDVTLRNIV